MTIRRVWLGSTGPFLFDDSVLYIDEAGVIAPDNQCAIATDGQIVVQNAPTSPVHVIRKQDLDDAIGDISSLEARVGSLEARTSNLESRFSSGTFNASVWGWNSTTLYLSASWMKIDKIVYLQLPAVNMVSTSDLILYGGFPNEIKGFNGTFTSTALVYTATHGYDWAGVFPYADQTNWQIEVRPFVKSTSWPSSGNKAISPLSLVYRVF